MRRASYDLEYADRVYRNDPVLMSRTIDYQKYASKAPAIGDGAEKQQANKWRRIVEQSVQVIHDGRYDDGIIERKIRMEIARAKRVG